MSPAAVTAARPPVYTSVENCPAWARETVQKAVDEGVLRGDQGGGLRLTDDNLVNLQMLRNLGLLVGGGACWTTSTASRPRWPLSWAD